MKDFNELSLVGQKSITKAPHHKWLTNEQKDRIISLFEEGKRAFDIAKFVEVKTTDVTRILRKAGYDLSKFKGGTRIKDEVLLNKFTEHTEFAHYIKGYIAADGNVSSNSIRNNKDGSITEKQINRISIISKDAEHIVKLANYLEYTTIIRKNELSILYFNSKNIKDYLVNLGITSKKSITFKYNGNFNIPFIRGIFDGDGSLSKGRPKITTGSELFLQQLSVFFKNLNYEFSIYEKNNAFDFVFIKDSKKEFIKAIYTKAGIYLDRKYHQAIELGLLDSDV